MKRRQAWRKALGRLLLAEAEDVDALLADAGGEPSEVAVGGDQAEAVEAAAVEQVHRVDHQRDVGGVLAGRVGELLLRDDRVLRQHVAPSLEPLAWRNRRRCGGRWPRRSWRSPRTGRRRSWARRCRRRSGRRGGAGGRPSAGSSCGCGEARAFSRRAMSRWTRAGPFSLMGVLNVSCVAQVSAAALGEGNGWRSQVARIVFHAANQCVYCGSVEGELTSEHMNSI